ncbi:hypothetical protein WR25_21153 [Diploscapter pachys]|uniref:ceramide glucosyltransferase n=1 Tax=Diploscapter pachys TaxID=2018661 RepID=A0A2A2L9Z6_9BILA|nr:hypothetical protein WR25_21153 [Diploscapter pachys]
MYRKVKNANLQKLDTPSGEASSSGLRAAVPSSSVAGEPHESLYVLSPIPTILRHIMLTNSGEWPSWLPTFLALLSLVFACSLYTIHAIALVYGKLHLWKKVKFDRKREGVSIIKPIVGLDANLEENLKCFCELDYHQYELHICFQKRDDPAVPLVKRVLANYPNLDVKIHYGGEKVGLNPKINNMMPAYRSAKYPLIVVSDSGIWMRSDALMDMVNCMQPGYALVTQVPYCKNRKGFANNLEQIYFGTSHARIYLAGNAMKFVCSTGMSSMFRKSALDECGGLEAFGGYLAEDYFFGLELMNRGWLCDVSTFPALQNSAHLTVDRFIDRISRWVKLRIAMLPHIIIVEPIQDCFTCGVLASLATSYLFGWNPLVHFTLHIIYWFTSDWTLNRMMQNGSLQISFPEYLLTWVVRETIAPFIFLYALCNQDIEWRESRFRLEWGGRIRQNNGFHNHHNHYSADKIK